MTPDDCSKQRLPARRIMWGGFSLLVLGRGWTLVLQSCHLRSCLLLRTMYFSIFFLFSFRILELPIMPFSPTLSLQFHLVSLQSSILCRLFQLLPSGQQVSQKSELGLHKHCWILDHRQLNHWEEGYRDNRLFWKTIGILLWRAITFIVRSRCCEGAESSNTHLIK